MNHDHSNGGLSFEEARAGTADTPTVASTAGDAGLAIPGLLHERKPGQLAGVPSIHDIAQDVPEVPSEAFHVEVVDVLNGALEEQYSSVVVIGLNADGELEVSGSHGDAMVRNMINGAIPAIDALQTEV